VLEEECVRRLGQRETNVARLTPRGGVSPGKEFFIRTAVGGNCGRRGDRSTTRSPGSFEEAAPDDGPPVDAYRVAAAWKRGPRGVRWPPRADFGHVEGL